MHSALQLNDYDYPHLTEEETEAERFQTLPRSYQYWWQCWGSDLDIKEKVGGYALQS